MTGERILVVEDEGLIALQLTEMLEKTGYQVADPVSSGEEALRELEKYPGPDLILMDIGLAGPLDGIETATLIRQRFSIPIILLTGYSSGEILRRVKEVSPEGVLSKPFMDQEMISAIRKTLELHVESKTG